MGHQVLAYGPGDYAGPHHDHHPEEPLARDGYTDVHVSLCNGAPCEQLLVYAPYAHFSEQQSVAVNGLVCRVPPAVLAPHHSAAGARWGPSLAAARHVPRRLSFVLKNPEARHGVERRPRFSSRRGSASWREAASTARCSD
ncbi:MAG: hypothetical protein IPJ65_39075 [Archangiaceae bacterium]|nr:hypothetical protein [Archangiaceae bacterium]